MEKYLNEIEIMYVKSKSGLKGASNAFQILEARLPNLKRRKFYGVYYRKSNEYFAGVVLFDQEKKEDFNLNTIVIPSGKYSYQKITNYHDNMDLITTGFKKLAKNMQLDDARPEIEFYKSYKEVVLYEPIL